MSSEPREAQFRAIEPDGGPVVVAMLVLFGAMAGLAGLLWAVFA